jgi:ABC-2 type transport system permease protein
MQGRVGLYFRYIGISVRSQMEYRGSFIMLSVGAFLITCIEFATIWLLYQRFGGIQGWSLAEVGLFYGMINTSFAVADSISRGFDSFSGMVKSGDFDRLLLRPRGTALQIIGTELALRRVGRLLQGLVVLAVAAANLGVVWTPARIALLCAAIVGGTCLFIGIVILQATVAFWTTESLEIFNSLTNGGVQTTQYPMSIYSRWLQRFFTYVVPLAAVSYFPGIALMGRADPLGSSVLFQNLAPLIGIGFLAVCLQAWKIGVRHYTSTGS